MTQSTKKYRDKGAVGALLDEYEKAIQELFFLLDDISTEELQTIVDRETNDEDCRSIQTILRHVVRAGYYYAICIRINQGEDLNNHKAKLRDSIEEYKNDIQEMFDYNLALFESYPNLKIEEYNPEKKMLTRWGQIYDVEQIYEHAIVHVLRHRRQIERFLIKLRGD